jgi:hypothetical protein
VRYRDDCVRVFVPVFVRCLSKNHIILLFFRGNDIRLLSRTTSSGTHGFA